MGVKNKKGIYEKFFKRPMDIMLSLVALVVLSPVFFIVAILVRIKLGSPVLFKQKRPGLNEKIFILYKFRTMTDEKDENGEPLPDEKRLTRFGQMLRSTSLDELPELWNILKGDMSIVGPRPLAVQYLPYYSREEKHRHNVRPGLSGLAQVNGRNAIFWEERFAYDLEYIRDISFRNDCRLIFQTIDVALKRRDISIRSSDGSTDFDKYRKAKLEEEER